MTQFPLKVVLNVDKQSVDTYFKLLDEAKSLYKYLIQHVQLIIKPTHEGYTVLLTIESPGAVEGIMFEIKELISRLREQKSAAFEDLAAYHEKMD